MNPRRVHVLGSTNTDLILRTPTLPKAGQTVLGSEILEQGGGKGANQAVAAARAGARVTFIGAVGDDTFGADRRIDLAAEGINVSHLRTLHDTRSGLAMIFVDSAGENVIGVAPGANASLTRRHFDLLPDELFTPGDIWVSQLECSPDVVQAGLRKASERGLRTILNAAPPLAETGQRDWLQYVDILVVNEHELGALTGGAIARGDAVLDRLSTLHDAGAAQVIVTLGSAGFLHSQPGRLRSEPAWEVEALDSVGAGDTFVGSLAARLAEGEGIDSAARWASASAALAVTRRGAQAAIPRRGEVDAFIARARQRTAPDGSS
jgi:ribokinase